jgi:glycerophosphoryl diester phosphodiesterase
VIGLILAVLTGVCAAAPSPEDVRSLGAAQFDRVAPPPITHTASASMPPDARAESPLAALRRRLRAPVAAAHQGGQIGGTWPNTLTNFEHARLAGVDIVEMDLHTTSDGVVVVYHDHELSNLTDCTGTIEAKTFAQLRACRFRLRWGSVIPTFDEVLAWSAGRVVVDAEFKDFESIAPALALMRQHGAQAWTYFQTQHNREKYARARAADASAALLYVVATQDDLAWSLSLRDDALLIIEVDERMRSPATISAVHAAGKLVTEDAWHFSTVPYEIAGSACTQAYAAGIDIPVSNRASGCAEQRDEFKRRLTHEPSRP